MADIDALLLNTELNITIQLIVQVALAVIVGALGYFAGQRGRPRWVRVAFVVTLVLAAAAYMGTTYRCEQARQSVTERWDGRTPGPHLSAERGQNHLNWVANCRVLGIGIAVASGLAGGLLYLAGQHRKLAEE